MRVYVKKNSVSKLKPQTSIYIKNVKSLILLTDVPLLLGGRGKGGFDVFLEITAPIVVISCSNMVFTVSQCTNVKCGISCDSKHDLMY